MNIYVCHSKHFMDYEKELYEPLKNSNLTMSHHFIFPHEKSTKAFSSKEMMADKKFDLILAEVSFPATGQGIELGWADCYDIPIICVYKEGSKIAGSLETISDKFIEYENSDDLISKLNNELRGQNGTI